jgi:hypothetical protein
MNRKVGLAWLFVGTTVVGCGNGSQKYPDTGVKFDAVPEVGRDAGSIETSMTPPPAPVPGVGSRLVVPGPITLIGAGADSCTNGVPATGDRWCAFTKPGTTLGSNELWVINATQAAANVAIKCDTSDANCLRLTSGLLEDQTNGFQIHGFDGDTLIYLVEPAAPVFAWRPGWIGGRQVTSTTGVGCRGHKTSDSIVCFDNVVTDTPPTQTVADLHAGKLSDPTGGLLPKVDTLFIAAKTDDPNARKWQVDMSPDGAYVAWSTRAAAAGLETLKMQRIGDDCSRKTIAADVTQWNISADSTTWYWLKKYNYNTMGSPSGALEAAAFPDGTGPTVLAADAADFSPAGAKGVLFRTKVTQDVGDLVLMADRSEPTALTTLDQNVLFVFDRSQDGKKAVYTKNAQTVTSGLFSAPIFDLFVAGSDLAKPCTLAATPLGFLAPDFLASGGVAAWGRLNRTTGEVEGMYTTVANCATSKFAAEILSWTSIGDEGYVYLDDLSPDPNLNEATLRFGQVKNGLLPAMGTKVQTRAAFVFASLLPTLPAVAYTVATNTAADGLYINAMLPFTPTPPVSPTDAGTGASDAAAPMCGDGGASETGASETGASETGASETAAPEAGAPEAGADADPDASQG